MGPNRRKTGRERRALGSFCCMPSSKGAIRSAWRWPAAPNQPKEGEIEPHRCGAARNENLNAVDHGDRARPSTACSQAQITMAIDSPATLQSLSSKRRCRRRAMARRCRQPVHGSGIRARLNRGCAQIGLCTNRAKLLSRAVRLGGNQGVIPHGKRLFVAPRPAAPALRQRPPPAGPSGWWLDRSGASPPDASGPEGWPVRDPR